MGNYQQDDNNRRQSAMQSLLGIFNLSNAPTVPLNSEEEANGELDEPPDKPLSLVHINPQTVLHQQHQQQQQRQSSYTKLAPPAMDRKESLLTRALMTSPIPEVSPPHSSPTPGALSRTSTFSNTSIPSNAELTSDGDDTSSARSATPSPPLFLTQYHQLQTSTRPQLPPPRISFATHKEQDRSSAVNLKGSKIEPDLGRKRCITFACAGKAAAKESALVEDEKVEAGKPQKRKCILTFACPARPPQTKDAACEPPDLHHDSRSSPASVSESPTPSKAYQKIQKQPSIPLAAVSETLPNGKMDTSEASTSPTKFHDKPSPFHEFETGADHDDAWIHEPIDSLRKLTLSDCMKKENAIRKIGEEAEEEAEQEQNDEDEDELEEENEDGDNEDDFAPSDDGNESDDEEGFAESDEDSDAASDDQFWVPSANTATTIVEHASPVRPALGRRQSGSSTDSLTDDELRRKKTSESVDIKYAKHRRHSKSQHLRPDTPELPDSTDFVCGTLDEDRPLEAAYISCREQKKREKHILIPQDIDPSFPTTDPDDIDEEDDEDLDIPEDHLWLEDQLEGFEDDSTRNHAPNQARKRSALSSPHRAHSPPPPKHVVHRSPPLSKHVVHRSPPPPKHAVHRSPPPPRQTIHRASSTPTGRLFGHSPTRLHSPPAPMKLSSPPGTRRQSPTDASLMTHQTQGLIISRLAQRPHMTRTSSLPRTPNPFFHNYHARTQQNDRVAFGAVTPGRELHVRGPVDIVIGLEKKRQKRKEKFWRQHCRKAAKEQAERKTIPGKGAQRMRELGLECAERTRGYGLGQQPALVISL